MEEEEEEEFPSPGSPGTTAFLRATAEKNKQTTNKKLEREQRNDKKQQPPLHKDGMEKAKTLPAKCKCPKCTFIAFPGVTIAGHLRSKHPGMYLRDKEKVILNVEICRPCGLFYAPERMPKHVHDTHPLLPPPWRFSITRNGSDIGKMFFYNPETKERTWAAPKGARPAKYTQGYPTTTNGRGDIHSCNTRINEQQQENQEQQEQLTSTSTDLEEEKAGASEDTALPGNTEATSPTAPDLKGKNSSEICTGCEDSTSAPALPCGHNYCRDYLFEALLTADHPTCPECDTAYNPTTQMYLQWPLPSPEKCTICAAKPPSTAGRRNWRAGHLRSLHPGAVLPRSLERQYNIVPCKYCKKYYAGKSGAEAHEKHCGRRIRRQDINISVESDIPSQDQEPEAGPGFPRNVWRRIPQETEALFVDLVRPILLAYQASSAAGNHAEMTSKLQEFLNVPRNHLRKPRGGKNGFAKARLAVHLSGSKTDGSKPPRMPDDIWPELETRRTSPNWTEEPEEDVSESEDSELEVDEDDDTLEQQRSRSAVRSVRRAIAYAKDGHLRRAVQALLRSEVLEPTPEIIERLRELHPDNTNQAPILPRDSPITVVDPIRLVQTIKNNLRSGGAPGRSKWTGDLTRVVIQDIPCRDAYACLIGDIINGRLNSSADREALLTDLLLAIGKPSPDGLDVRPLALGEQAVKHAGLYGLDLTKPAMQEEFGDIQLAIATPGASTTAIQILREGLGHDADSLVLQADYKTAYQRQKRAEALRRIYEVPGFSPLWRLLDWSYGQGATPLLILSKEGNLLETLQSADGWKQGCVLGPFAFCGGAIKTYKAAVEGLPRINKAAIIDDFNVSGDPESVFKVYDRLNKLSPDIGLHLHPTKSHLAWLHDHPIPRWIQEEAAARKIEIVVGTDKCLGSLLTSDPLMDKVAQFVAEKVDKHKRLFDLVTHEEMPKQIGKEILRSCGIPKMAYVSKTIEPSPAVLEQYNRFDKMVELTYDQLCSQPGAAEDEETPNIEEVHMPCWAGGGGFPASTEIAPIAFVASIAQAVPWLSNLPNSPLKPSLTRTVETMRTSHPSLPDCLSGFWKRFEEPTESHRLQRRLTHTHFEAKRAAQLPTLPQRDRAVIICRANAGLGQVVLPTEEEYTLTNLQMAISERFLQNLPIATPSLQECPTCGRSWNWDHALTCVGERRRSVTLRHDLITRCFKSMADEASIHCLVEIAPRVLDQNRSRPDLMFFIGSKVIYADVEVVYPLTESHLPAASRKARATVNTAARAKKKKYKALAEAAGAEFIALIFDVYGGMAAETRRLISTLAEQVAANWRRPHARTPTTKRFQAKVSSTLRKANATILTEGTQRLMEHTTKQTTKVDVGLEKKKNDEGRDIRAETKEASQENHHAQRLNGTNTTQEPERPFTTQNSEGKKGQK
eukprot:Lithocolla_globosa_v1_NODE_309_length_4559_cov_14.810169.p1 type:complete len:1418 gc:universal NODE_309_length_4559_cov_14.810169:274-4527(+)